MKMKSLFLAATVALSAMAGIAFADNASVTVLPSVARPAATSYIGGPFTNYNWKGVRLYLQSTALQGTDPTVDCKIEIQDSVSGVWWPLTGASFAQVVAVATPTPLVVYPGLTAVTNKVVTDVLPRIWRVNCLVGPPTASSATGMTFSIGASLQQN
jgi:hypothetical protein